ncbi:TIGR04255 family protein [Candidatus Electrothrix sp.]|uniref:TIGR04255 family protein n=1 Tax=Candidatus Electrothrix sp. TaxID=2170559 RepID=UPI004057AE35
MTRPAKITPDPIINAVVELRFNSSVPEDAVLGMLFAQIKSKYNKFQKLPVADFPKEVRMNDQALQFNPYYQCEAGAYRLNVGPKVISLAISKDYPGWKEHYFPEVKSVLSHLDQAGIVDNFIRIGVRYIDFFENNIFDNINLSISLKEHPLDALQQTFNAIFKNKNEGFLTRVQVVNNITAMSDGLKKNGSIIDTDTYIENKQGFEFSGIENIINSCHELSVDFFFDLLKKEFIDTLNPEYENDQ